VDRVGTSICAVAVATTALRIVPTLIVGVGAKALAAINAALRLIPTLVVGTGKSAVAVATGALSALYQGNVYGVREPVNIGRIRGRDRAYSIG
jgi:hypothetical protein